MAIFDSLTHLLGFGGNPGGGSMNSANRYLGQQAGLANQYGQLAQGGFSDYGQDNAASRGATSSLLDYLKRDPYTDSYSTGVLNNATQGTTDAYLRGKATLQNKLLSQGTGMDSGAGVGGLAGLELGRAGTLAGAQNQLAMQKIGQHGSNLEAIAQILSGRANQSYGRGVGALGAQSGILGGLGQAYLGQGNADRARQDAQDQQTQQLIATIAQFYGAGG